VIRTADWLTARLTSAHRIKTGLSFVALACALVSTSPAHGFYEGKTINIVVGADAGTGFDVYARVLGRHMHRHIPGKPNIVVQNMPGAGSVKAAEYLYAIAPKDGTTFAILFPGALVEPLIGDPTRYRYDPVKFGYLGTADSGTRLCITYHTSKARSFEDAQRIPSIIGATQPGSSTSDYPNMLNALAGAKFKIVTGYKSTVEIVLAMERGEVDGVCGHELSSVRSQRPDWIGSRTINHMLQVGLEANDELTKLGMPGVWKFVPEENRAVMELIVGQQVFGRPFAAPPGIPEARLELLRRAFMATLADPEFLADAKKAMLDVNPKSGKEVATVIKRMFSAPKDVASRMSKAIRP
jgi:tripartite-type tricarboxylate transporter receptor subunit TctC